MSVDGRLQIVSLREEHVLSCARLMASSEPWTRYDLHADAAASLWRRALRDGAGVSIACLEARVVGFAWYVAAGAFGLSGYLKQFGVDVGARGRGVGTALLDHIERRTVEDSQHDLFLLVSDFNLAAQRFYQGRGYEQVGALQDYVMPGIAELIYRKRLE